MALAKSRKEELVKEFGRGNNDTGSVEVQVAILTEEIQIIYRVVGHGTRQFSNLQSGEEIKILLKSILRVVKEVERHLLNVNCILMDPEYIFYTEEKYYFCCRWSGNCTGLSAGKMAA